jgi:tetratricopeptide (TPR) repeat protein
VPATDFVSRGQALVAAGQYQEAVKICRLGLLAKPTDLAGRLILGQALLALRRYDEVLAEMRVAVSSDPGNAGAHQLRGEAFLRKGDAFAAVESLERARELAHGDPTIAALLAEARHAVEVDASRTTGADGLADLDGDTKHYPSHRGGEGAGSGRPGSVTRPVQAKGGRPGGARPASPSLDHLHVGDSSGTVEVDPDREGLEVDDDDLGDAIDPPSYDVGGSGEAQSIIVDDADLIELEPDEVSRPGQAAARAPAASLPARVSAPPAAERAVPAERAPAPVVPLFGTSSDPTRGGRPRPLAPLSPSMARGSEPPAPASLRGAPPSTSPARGSGAGATSRRSASAAAPAAAPARPDDDPGLETRSTGQRTAEWGADEVSTGSTRQRPRAAPPPADRGDAPTAPRSIVDGEPTGPDANRDHSQQVAPIDPRRPRGREPRELRESPRAAAPPTDQEESSLPGRGQHPELAKMASGPLMAFTPAPQLSPSGRYLPASGPGAPAVEGHGAPADEDPSRSPVPRVGPQVRTMVPVTQAAVQAAAKPTIAMRPEPEILDGRGPDGPAAPLPPPPVGPPHGMPGLPPHGMAGPLHHGMPPGPMLSQAELMRMMGPGPAPFTRRSPLVLALWAVVTVAIIGAGVLAGFKIRALRLDKQIAAARRGAEESAQADTWLGWRGARDRLAGILRASPRAAYRAALARAEAVLAADFLDDVERARSAVAELGPAGGKDGALARAYVALAAGDPAAAGAAVDALGRDDPQVALVLARAALQDGRADDAAGHARVAIDRGRRPAALLALCDAERARKRWSDANRACADAEVLVPGHPGAIVGKARVAAASGAARADQAGFTGALDALIAEAAKPETEQRLGVSRGQEVWANLALAEVSVIAGDTARARRALERAEASKLDGRELREARAAIRLAVGDVDTARDLATAGLMSWPRSVPLAVVKTRAALAAHHLDEAARELDRLDGAAVTASVDALVARGEVALARGALDAAAKDLDAAIGRAPDFEDGVVARARLDLAQGDARAALARLDSRAGTDAPPRVAIVYAAAQRTLGQLELARRAIAPLLDDPPGPMTGQAFLESARIARDAGDVAAARTAYGKAAEMLASSEVRVEAAMLAIDAGDASGGRDTLVPLAAEPGADGMVLIQAARAQILCGKLDDARALLERADTVSGRPEALHARERGRLALRRRDAAGAIAALERAVAAAPTDLEAQLMLMDAYIIGENITGAQRVDNELKRSYPQRPERLLAGGRTALLANQVAEARDAFAEAGKGLAKAPQRVRADASYWLGLAYSIGGDTGLAKSALVEATRLDPHNADAHAVLGQVLRALGDTGGAIASFRRAAELDPENVELDADLGELLAARQPKEAVRLLDRYLARVPAGERADAARALLARLRR